MVEEASPEPEGPNFLVDTSVWIPVLRQRRRGQLSPLQERIDELLAADLVATTGVVRTELLVGAGDADAFERLRSLLLGVQYVETDARDWVEAGRLGQRLRLAGVSTQTTDLVIAAVAIRSGSIVLHRDADFERIAEHSVLKTESHL